MYSCTCWFTYIEWTETWVCVCVYRKEHWSFWALSVQDLTLVHRVVKKRGEDNSNELQKWWYQFVLLLEMRAKKALAKSMQNHTKKSSPWRGIEPPSPVWQTGILITILPRNCTVNLDFTASVANASNVIHFWQALQLRVPWASREDDLHYKCLPSLPLLRKRKEATRQAHVHTVY